MAPIASRTVVGRPVCGHAMHPKCFHEILQSGARHGRVHGRVEGHTAVRSTRALRRSAMCSPHTMCTCARAPGGGCPRGGVHKRAVQRAVPPHAPSPVPVPPPTRAHRLPGVRQTAGRPLGLDLGGQVGPRPYSCSPYGESLLRSCRLTRGLGGGQAGGIGLQQFRPLAAQPGRPLRPALRELLLLLLLLLFL